MNKALNSFDNIKREAGTPYFSSLYDIEMWKEDIAIVEEALHFPEKMNEDLFEFYFSGLISYSKAEKAMQLNFYMGSLETIIAIYAKANNISNEDAKNQLADLAKKRIKENK